MAEGRLRKWLLSISALLRNQNGGVAQAIGLWKRNVDKEFEGERAGSQAERLGWLGGGDCSGCGMKGGKGSLATVDIHTAREVGDCSALRESMESILNAIACGAPSSPAAAGLPATPCRPGGVPDLLQHHPAHQWPAAAPGVPHLPQEVPPAVPLQVVQVQRQVQLPTLPESLVTWMFAIRPTACTARAPVQHCRRRTLDLLLHKLYLLYMPNCTDCASA